MNILREDWKPVLNLNSVMVGLQYLFLEPNADDPLNKGKLPFIPCQEVALMNNFHIQRPRRIYERAEISSSRMSNHPCEEETSKVCNTTESCCNIRAHHPFPSHICCTHFPCSSICCVITIIHLIYSLSLQSRLSRIIYLASPE